MEEQGLAMPKQKKSPKKGILIILALFLVGSTAAAAGFFYRQWQAESANAVTDEQIASLQAQVADLKSQLEEAKKSSTCSPTQPDATAVENIKASVTTRNTQPLEGYMASSVTVIYAASEGLGARTPTEAVSDIGSFLGETTVDWTFDIPAETLTAYSQGDYAQYFPSTSLVTKSSENKVISFNFDCDGKIVTVFMSYDESLLK